MNNRFNLNEEEKNDIRALHGINKSISLRLINEQEEEESVEDELELDFTKLNSTVNDLQKRLTELEDDYMRKIGYGDHHQHPPPL